MARALCYYFNQVSADMRKIKKGCNETMKRKLHLTSGRKIVLCFLGVILTGAILLSLPISRNPGTSLSFLDALFTATSATCVTGLVITDTAETFNTFGRIVILLMIQIGGLGVAVMGVGVTVLAGRRAGLRERELVKESWNVGSYHGLIRLLNKVLLMTVCFEGAGAVLSTLAFMREMPFWKALGTGIFHAVSSFNNAGFDVFGGGTGMTTYYDDVPLCLITAGLVILSGLGYLVLLDIGRNGLKTKKYSLQTRVVLVMTAVLLAAGALLLYVLEDISPLAAFFQSVSARTAGFGTVDFTNFSSGGILVMCFLMFVGASPGSTGGGIKTTTLFALLLSAKASATNTKRQAFKRKIPDEVFRKAFTLLFMALVVVFATALLLSAFEPELSMSQILFESFSAFGTVGLSAGVTPTLCSASRIVLIITMFTGRMGPITMATVWVFRREPAFEYSEEHITIG